MYNFCTLFDSNYLSRGIALYNSIEKHSVDFHLYVFAFDENVLNTLSKLNLDRVTVISLSDFEDKELLKIKSGRTIAEYCWTCTSSTILFCIQNFHLDNCTYIDADMYFYSNPKIIFDEIGYASVGLTGHNYTKQYDQSVTSGKYCVQFVYFKNDENGMKALKWWRDACIEWCYCRLEDGKFGDQKYLDDWTERFQNVYIIKNEGVGIAPWNIQKYKVGISTNSNIYLTQKRSNKSINIVFYHFHALNYKLTGKVVDIVPTKFKIDKDFIEIIYKPYLDSLLKIELHESRLNYELNFKENSYLIKMYLPIHFRLKKIIIFQKLKKIFVKSIR